MGSWQFGERDFYLSSGRAGYGRERGRDLGRKKEKRKKRNSAGPSVVARKINDDPGLPGCDVGGIRIGKP